LTVGSVAHGGMCVARADGLVIFVRHALPGERVLAKVTETGRRYWRADAVQILEASPDRVREPCSHARPGHCGGCDWQHVTLTRQRELKATVIREQLHRLAGLDVEVEVAEVPGSPDGLGWRTRVRFAVGPDGRAGLHRHRSDTIERLEACPIAASGINASGVLDRRWDPRTEVAVEVAGEDLRIEGTLHAADAGPPYPPPQALTYEVAGRRFRVSPGSFWQVHPAAAEILSDTVLEMLAPAEGERALDLYAGVGLFAARLAEAVGPTGSVLAVEGLPSAIADALVNLADLPQALVREAPVNAASVTAGGRPNVVVLDPPRSGAGRQVIEALAAAEPRAIAYVACDPAPFARDVAVAAESGYALRALRAFDLFPMTAHVECVALLQR
jgi:tRNA/tmRNA/rRNA uracil-C5-methylase (TrmA/RlmC/RlmD family)